MREVSDDPVPRRGPDEFCHGDVFRCACGGQDFTARIVFDRMSGWKVRWTCVACKQVNAPPEDPKAPEGLTEWELHGISRRTWYRRKTFEKAKARALIYGD